MSIKNLSVFVLTTNTDTGLRRQTHVRQCLDKYQFKSVQFIIAPKVEGTHSYRVAMGHISVLEQITSFPALVLEDDISDWDDHISRYTNIDFPHNADLVYAGISKCGARKITQPIVARETNWYDFNIHLAPYDDNFMIMCNMLGGHAIIYCNQNAVNFTLIAMMEASKLGIPWDVLMANTIQTALYCYAIKYPWFYQDLRYGGQEEPTKFLPKPTNNPMPTSDDLGSRQYVKCADCLN